MNRGPTAARGGAGDTLTREERCPRVCVGCDEACSRRLAGSDSRLEAEIPSLPQKALGARIRQFLILLGQACRKV